MTNDKPKLTDSRVFTHFKDKPNLTDSHFAEVLAEPFAELLKPKKFYPTITVEYSPNKEEKRLLNNLDYVEGVGSLDRLHTH